MLVSDSKVFSIRSGFIYEAPDGQPSLLPSQNLTKHILVSFLEPPSLLELNHPKL